MGWIKQNANEHRCRTPHLLSDTPEAKSGDIWQCDNSECKRTYRVRGFDSGMHWDSYPTVILWEEVISAGDGRWIQK